MTTETYDARLAPAFRQRLARREAELQRLLQDFTADVLAGDGPSDVSDFKALASERSLAAVDDAQAAQAHGELRAIAAARKRLDEGLYGLCASCGEPIDLRRLLALPAAVLCPDCQTAAEHRRRA